MAVMKFAKKILSKILGVYTDFSRRFILENLQGLTNLKANI